MPRNFLLLAAAVIALALPTLSSTAVGPDTTALRDAVTVDGMAEHLAALQAIADANDDTRVDGTDGYEESVDYVVERLEDGRLQGDPPDFSFEAFQSYESTVLERISPDPASTSGFTEDFASGVLRLGDVTAQIVAIDVVVPR